VDAGSRRGDLFRQTTASLQHLPVLASVRTTHELLLEQCMDQYMPRHVMGAPAA
jgi:hypothetical protein